MRASRIFAAAWTALGVIACGDDDPSSTLPPGVKVIVGDTGTELEPSAGGVRTFLESREYRAWAAEPAVHAAAMNSPHDEVRVFFNRLSVDALRAGSASLPIGSMIVKELYEEDRTTLGGFSVMIKTADSSWTWWEAFDPDPESPAYFGVDHRTCKPCHSGATNRDQVRTPPP